MVKKIKINPLTRISGFLEIDVEIKNNVITDAKSSGMLFRGFEDMLKNRPPLDAIYFTQRICGICSTAHSMASSLALEDALVIKPNLNDRLIRHFIHGCEFLQNHLRHFYLYTFPDFVKIPDISDAFKQSHSDYRLPEQVNKKLADHYLKSIEYSKLAHKMLAKLAGKAPHNHGIFVGGVTVNMNASLFIEVKSILDSIKDFVENIMIDDLNTIANYYPDYFNNGKGYGNLMSFGLMDEFTNQSLFYVNPGTYTKGKFGPFNSGYITENIQNAWYESASKYVTPLGQETTPNVYKKDAYSFVKAPRYNGTPFEVGPLARQYLSGEYRNGISTMDRTIARGLETKKMCEIMSSILENIVLKPTNQEQYQIPEIATGVGLIDTTRGALGHWIKIQDQTIENYSIITPTTWNLSPADSLGIKGVVEKALIGTHIEDTDSPVEIGRIVRSFDPCVSCATHVTCEGYKDINIRVV